MNDRHARPGRVNAIPTSPERADTDELERLLNGLVDETLTETEQRRLAAILVADETARQRYRHAMELHAALQWDYATAAVPASQVGEAAAPLMPSSQSGSWIARLSAWQRVLLGAALLVAGGVVLIPGWVDIRDAGGSRSIVEVVAIGGSASWSGGGAPRARLQARERLPEGLVSLEGDSAFMGLRFLDGTSLTLVGESLLEFGERGQKTLFLRRGSLSIDARPQPEGKPMLIRTPSADVEVVGTVLAVSADDKVTQLGVESGSVRMRRLVDGKVVDVPKNQIAIASLDAALPLAASSPAATPASFEHAFDVPTSLKWEGTWLPAEAGGVARLRAVPRIAGRWPDATPIIHHGVSLRAPEAGFVAFGAESTVTIRCRMSRRETLRVMLNMRRPEGTFAGNFEAKVPLDPADDAAGEDGWRTVSIPAAAFLPIVDGHPRFTPGMAVSLLLIETFTSEAALEVAGLSVSGGSTQDEDSP